MNRRMQHARPLHTAQRPLALGENPTLAAQLRSSRRIYIHHGLHVGGNRAVRYAIRSVLPWLTVTSALVLGPLNAKAADGQVDVLEEVIITAQKRSERLQDTPVAAQVVSSRALAAANVADLSDLNNLVPSVQSNGTINGRVPIGIRGISTVSSEGTVGISSGVAVMIDGVPVLCHGNSTRSVGGNIDSGAVTGGV